MTIDNGFDSDLSDKTFGKFNQYYDSNSTCENLSSYFDEDNLEIKSVDKLLKSKATVSSRTCSNCGTSSTSTWRNLGDQIVCNACKCFYRKHGRNRPIHMRKDTIITRHRKVCKLTVPNEGMFELKDEPILQISEPDSKIVAEAVCMMLHYLQNL